MADVTSRFTIAGTDYDYEADRVVVEWEEDADRYRRLDNVVEKDVRALLPVISFEAVLVARNANASGVSAADLYELIRTENTAGNTCTFTPDTSASAPNSATPSVDILTRSPPPTPYRLDQKAERLRRSLTLQGARWLDPSVTADKELIDDLNSLSEPI